MSAMSGVVETVNDIKSIDVEFVSNIIQTGGHGTGISTHDYGTVN